MTFDSSLLQVLTTVAGSVGAVYAGIPWLLTKTSTNTFSTVAAVAEKAVAAIEQTQGAASGDQKKALALNLVSSILSSMHIQAPAPFIDAAVEAAVLGLSLFQPPSASPPPAPQVATPPGAIILTSGTSPSMGSEPSG